MNIMKPSYFCFVEAFDLFGWLVVDLMVLSVLVSCVLFELPAASVPWRGGSSKIPTRTGNQEKAQVALLVLYQNYK